MILKTYGCAILFWISISAFLGCHCYNTTLTPIDPEVIEGSDVVFVCKMDRQEGVGLHWQLRSSSNETSYAALHSREGHCYVVNLTGEFRNINKYNFYCNHPIFKVTIKDVRRTQHKYRIECKSRLFTINNTESTINVQVPVSQVSISPSQDVMDIKENTTLVFTCKTSEARPRSTVTWYSWKSNVTSEIDENVTSETTDDDFSVTTSTLRFVPSRLDNGVRIFCKANNTVNNNTVQSNETMLNVLSSPYPPSEFRYIKDLSTTTSIHLEWKPGYNGGYPQIFHIRYKLTSTSTWSQVDINDTGEDSLHYVLTGLAQNTQFDIVISASNKIGSSLLSTILIATTKAPEVNKPSNQSSVVGGVVGGLLAVIILVVVVLYLNYRYNLLKVCLKRNKEVVESRMELQPTATTTAQVSVNEYEQIINSVPSIYTTLESTDNNQTSVGMDKSTKAKNKTENPTTSAQVSVNEYEAMNHAVRNNCPAEESTDSNQTSVCLDSKTKVVESNTDQQPTTSPQISINESYVEMNNAYTTQESTDSYQISDNESSLETYENLKMPQT